MGLVLPLLKKSQTDLGRWLTSLLLRAAARCCGAQGAVKGARGEGGDCGGASAVVNGPIMAGDIGDLENEVMPRDKRSQNWGTKQLFWRCSSNQDEINGCEGGLLLVTFLIRHVSSNRRSVCVQRLISKYDTLKSMRGMFDKNKIWTLNGQCPNLVRSMIHV